MSSTYQQIVSFPKGNKWSIEYIYKLYCSKFTYQHFEMKGIFYVLLVCLIFNVGAVSAQVAIPPIVPPFTVNINGSPQGGHLFMSAIDMLNPTSDWPSTVMLLDEEAELLFYMPITNVSAAPYPRRAVGDFKMHPDGRMSFTDALFGPIGNIYIMDSTFFIVDTLNCTPPYKLDGHDFVISSDGHYHLLAMEERVMDASALTTESGQAGDVNCVVTGHIIQEFDENKILVGEWKSLDHYALSDIYQYYFTDPLAMDHAHVNSLFVDFEGNYIISSRSLNEITRIDHQTGDIIWRLGGKNNEFTFLIDTLQFTSQHDAQYYSDGTLVLFDNATNTIPDNVSRMLTYDLDDVNMTVSPVINFQHPLNFPSGFMGSARTLNSDNFIISWGGGYDYSQGKSIQEFDDLWNEVLSVDLYDGFASYRAIKSELSWAVNRPVIECNDGTMILSTFDNYSSYYWSTGETTPTITISSPGSYQVWTNVGDGFMSSEVFEVLDLNDLCGVSGVSELDERNISVYPVPANNGITVDWGENSNGVIEIVIYDLIGREVYQQIADQGAKQMLLNTQEIPSGMYTLRMTDRSNSGIIERKISIAH